MDRKRGETALPHLQLLELSCFSGVEWLMLCTLSCSEDIGQANSRDKHIV
jgi:hypothetical protein